MKKLDRRVWGILLVVLATVGCVLTSCTEKRSEEDVKKEILGRLKNCASLVSAEIDYRKIVRFKYDKGNVSLNPKTWDFERVGDAVVVVPMKIKVQYGYDLSHFSADNVKVSDDNTEVWVYLPEPRIITYGFDTSESYDNMEVITTGFCPKPTNAKISEVIQREFELAIKELPNSNNAKEVEQNAKQILEDILLKVNSEFKTVNIVSMKDKKGGND